MEWLAALESALKKGLAAFSVLPPVALWKWSDEHFYLSEESSYTRGAWRTLPTQMGIMACMTHDDIAIVVILKAARMGGSKMQLAFMAYTACRLRRSQAIWKPTDADAAKFSTVDLDTVIRDVPVLSAALPNWDKRRAPENKQDLKRFIGAPAYIRGAQSARGFRDLTVHTGQVDEMDACPRDVEGEGSVAKLAFKRTEGSPYRKAIFNSTPTLHGFSRIDEEKNRVERIFRYFVPCPHAYCGGLHVLEWRDLDEIGDNRRGHGFTWFDDDPATACYICPHCHTLYHQSDFLANYHRGRWIDAAGVWMDTGGDGPPVFRGPDNQPVKTPYSVAFDEWWTAYSPWANWVDIAREFIAAYATYLAGDEKDMKVFFNTFLCRVWRGKTEKTEADALKKRAEPYPLGVVPHGAVEIYVGVDAQADRFEIVVWGYGEGEESWVVSYEKIEANPAMDAEWERCLDPWLDKVFPHAGGKALRLSGMAVDSGNWSVQAYKYVRKRKSRKVIAVKGAKAFDAEIVDRVKHADKSASGKSLQYGVKVWNVGVNKAKDALFQRLSIETPGSGYVHFSSQLPDDFYVQLTSEERVTQNTASGAISRWLHQDKSKRNEVLDCTVYAYACALVVGKMDRRQPWDWKKLRESLMTETMDLFAMEEAPLSDGDHPPPKTKPQNPQGRGYFIP